MFSFSDISILEDKQPAYRVFKPWWDTFMDYLTIIMLFLAIFGCSIQLYMDETFCLPHLGENDEAKQNTQDETSSILQNTPEADDISANPDEHTKSSPSISIHNGRVTKLYIWQYWYVNQMCYSQIPWFTRFFSYLILFHTVVLIICSNFCFTYPKTSSKLQQFLDILQKCFQSPWTTKALSTAVCVDSREQEEMVTSQKPSESEKDEISIKGDSSLAKAPTRIHSNVSVYDSTLDKKEAEQAKALFEKVRKFRLHVEEKDTIYKLYAGQTLFKTIHCLIIIGYFPAYIYVVDFNNLCEPNALKLVYYKAFDCTYSTARFVSKMALLYLGLVIIYWILCIHTICWVFRNPLRSYSFEKKVESQFSDIPEVSNDFAFLLHLIDQYDTLYSKRLTVFLSEVSEQKLKLLSLNNDWTVEKVKQNVTKTKKDQYELYLFMLSGIPESVYEVTELQVLRLELCSNVKISNKITQLEHLEEIWLSHCVTEVTPSALTWLKYQLKKLGIKYVSRDEIPDWIYKLIELKELYLTGKLAIEKKGVELEPMKGLRSLRVLYLKTSLSKIPSTIIDVALHLLKLCIHNDKTKISSLSILKKMVNLTQIELHNCELDKIPTATYALSNLQVLDLKGNNLTKIEDVSNLQYLQKLSCLKFWFNMIKTIPATINLIKELEYLYLNNNHIEVLPKVLFMIDKLRYLDLHSNNISVLPSDVGNLKNLYNLDLGNNKIETLPDQLFKCNKLMTLKLSNNLISSISGKISKLSQLSQLELQGNYMEKLPVEIGQCPMLKLNGLVIEPHVVESLPLEVREKMGGS
ncbi:volume-regulated anion channel subunit LRRC8D-like [Hemiscyllium ocellatum]|uniref:volume-regulated anion channel subunit LRRC8D-like n=1 Tax=Hemiscyllium ocellatum TaxID=170820 RepID=UPI00296704D7|nr:volume-regulated anion channel subunit LRRC8D-like [Hemiscyllium ocellatum]